MPYVLIVGLNFSKVRCRIKIVLKKILSQMLVSSIAKKQTSANTSRILENVYNTNNARGLFQLINLEWEFIQNCSPVLWLHVFVEPGKTMIKVVVKSSNYIDIYDFNNILCSYDTKLDMI